MSSIPHVVFDPKKARAEFSKFKNLLKRPNLSEKRDILPFFARQTQMAALGSRVRNGVRQPNAINRIDTDRGSHGGTQHAARASSFSLAQ
jgi:hypothetical protein